MQNRLGPPRPADTLAQAMSDPTLPPAAKPYKPKRPGIVSGWGALDLAILLLVAAAAAFYAVRELSRSETVKIDAPTGPLTQLDAPAAPSPVIASPAAPAVDTAPAAASSGDAPVQVQTAPAN
jgi:hypothetical protein